jgi:4'-phosphopantetheinyl transferase
VTYGTERWSVFSNNWRADSEWPPTSGSQSATQIRGDDHVGPVGLMEPRHRPASWPLGPHQAMEGLRQGEVHIWWAHASDVSQEHEALLNRIETERLASLRRSIDRARFLTGVAITRLGLAIYVDGDPRAIAIDRECPKCGRPHGKPKVQEPPDTGIEFSVSHAGEVVVVAFAADRQLGVDVEPADSGRDTASAAPLALSRREQQEFIRLPAAERERGFLVWWTRKEALIKATEHGLALSPAGVEVTPPYLPPRLRAWHHDSPPTAVQLFDLSAPAAHVASLAVLGAEATPIDCAGSDLLASFRSSPDGGADLLPLTP